MARSFVAGTALVLAVLVACSDAAAPPPEEEGPPAIQLIGRFDTSTVDRPTTAWPGGRIVARFSGASVSATLTQTAGEEPGNTWLNVIVDGTMQKKIEVTGAKQVFELATGLSAGNHTVELEKRTEANLGAVTLEALTFPGEGKLLSPPRRKTRRIEFLADSTIDGFGSDGDLDTTCKGGNPPELNNVRKSVVHFMTTGMDAESHLLAYSGKGVAVNEGGETGETYPSLYTRTLPRSASSTWDFTSWTPDVVVLSVGGSDVENGTAAAGFQAAYDALVTSIRKRHPNAQIYMTVWSQIKAYNKARTALKAVLDAVLSAHASDKKLHVFVWKEADSPSDETGCAEHANEAHARETANEIVPAIKSATGWK